MELLYFIDKNIIAPFILIIIFYKLFYYQLEFVCHLVKEHPGQGHTLDQRRRGLVSSAKEVDPHRAAAPGEVGIVFRNLFPAVDPQLSHPLTEWLGQIAPERADGLAAEGDVLPRLAAERPRQKGEPGAGGLARAHRPIADDGIVPLAEGRTAPPAQHLLLFVRPAHRVVPAATHRLCHSSPKAPAAPSPP